jgi:hypothetical protein
VNSSAEPGTGLSNVHGTDVSDNESAITLFRMIFEGLVLLLLMLAIERLFFGPGYYASLSIHPFWIVVLITSVQNGLYVGVITTALAGLLMEWPPRPIGADITAHYLSVAILPLQWLLVSFCIGIFRQAQIRTEQRLLSDKARLIEINEALAIEIMRLDEMVHDLELNATTAPRRQSDTGQAVRN